MMKVVEENSNFIPSCPLEKIKKGDFHSWIEDSNEKVVYDPHFPQYDDVKEIHGIDEDAEQIHYKFSNQEKCCEKVRRRAIELTIQYSHMAETGGRAAAFLMEPRFGFCSVNCHLFMRKPENRNKGYKFAIGAMGWDTGCGDTWFEYG